MYFNNLPDNNYPNEVHVKEVRYTSITRPLTLIHTYM